MKVAPEPKRKLLSTASAVVVPLILDSRWAQTGSPVALYPSLPALRHCQHPNYKEAKADQYLEGGQTSSKRSNQETGLLRSLLVSFGQTPLPSSLHTSLVRRHVEVALGTFQCPRRDSHPSCLFFKLMRWSRPLLQFYLQEIHGFVQGAVIFPRESGESIASEVRWLSPVHRKPLSSTA